MAHQIQRWWGLSAGSYDEWNRRVAQLCVQAIANLNWKHFGSGSYKGHIKDIYSEQAVSIINYFDPSDDDCEYLLDCLSDQSHYGASNYCYHHYQSMLETERNEKTLTFHLAYLEATCYRGHNLTLEDLYSSWEGKPSPWLDTILVKIGKQMSDWEFYSWEDDDVLADVNAWDTQATTLIQ